MNSHCMDRMLGRAERDDAQRGTSASRHAQVRARCSNTRRTAAISLRYAVVGMQTCSGEQTRRGLRSNDKPTNRQMSHCNQTGGLMKALFCFMCRLCMDGTFATVREIGRIVKIGRIGRA